MPLAKTIKVVEPRGKARGPDQYRTEDVHLDQSEGAATLPAAPEAERLVRPQRLAAANRLLRLQVLRRTASRPEEKRFQLSSSWPSARRPAAVRR